MFAMIINNELHLKRFYSIDYIYIRHVKMGIVCNMLSCFLELFKSSMCNFTK